MSISSCEGSTIVVLAIHKHNEEVGPKFYEVSTWILFDQKCPIYVSICPQNAGVDRRTLFSFSPPYGGILCDIFTIIYVLLVLLPMPLYHDIFIWA